MCEELILWFGFRKTDDALAVFELAAFAEEFHAFETFQDTAASGDAALAFQTWMLAHKIKLVVENDSSCCGMQSHSLANVNPPAGGWIYFFKASRISSRRTSLREGAGGSEGAGAGARLI